MSDTIIQPATWYVYLLRRITPQDFNALTGEITPLLKCEGVGSRLYYVGMTNTLQGRIDRHNRGEVKATRGQQWELLAYATMESRKQAAVLERWLKNGDTRKKRSAFARLLQLDSRDREQHSREFFNLAQLWSAQRQLRLNARAGGKVKVDHAIQ